MVLQKLIEIVGFYKLDHGIPTYSLYGGSDFDLICWLLVHWSMREKMAKKGERRLTFHLLELLHVFVYVWYWNGVKANIHDIWRMDANERIKTTYFAVGANKHARKGVKREKTNIFRFFDKQGP